jgi:hypothetical protein
MPQAAAAAAAVGGGGDGDGDGDDDDDDGKGGKEKVDKRSAKQRADDEAREAKWKKREQERAMELLEDESDRNAAVVLRKEQNMEQSEMAAELNEADAAAAAANGGTGFGKAAFESVLTDIQRYALKLSEVHEPVVSQEQVAAAEKAIAESEQKWEVEQRNKIKKLSAEQTAKQAARLMSPMASPAAATPRPGTGNSAASGGGGGVDPARLATPPAVRRHSTPRR